MSDPFKIFTDARDRAFEIVNGLRPILAEADKALKAAEDAGRAADIKVSRIHSSLPSLSHSIRWPEGLEPPAPARTGGLLAHHHVGTIRRALELAKTDPEGFDLVEVDRLLDVFSKADAAMICTMAEG